MTLDRQDWIDSAAATANSFLMRYLAFEPFRHMGVVPNRLEQIAYGTNMVVQAYAALYEATGEQRYADLAALAGSWLFGNNMAGVQMYNPENGRTFDGINGPVAWRVNRNAGAESTIEGLMSISTLAKPLQARRNCCMPERSARRVRSSSKPRMVSALSARRCITLATGRERVTSVRGAMLASVKDSGCG